MRTSGKRIGGKRVGFRDGFLYLSKGETLIRVRAWPTLEVELRAPDGSWLKQGVALRDHVFACIGYLLPPAPTDFDFVGGGWWNRDDGQGYLGWALDRRERRRTWGQFGWERLLATVPGELRRELASIDVDWFSAVALAQNAPDALDLLAHDRLLFAALARHWEFPAVGREDWPAVREHARRKRRDILAWLGFTPSEAVVNALRRHRVVVWDTTSVGTCLRQFLEVMQDPTFGPELLGRKSTRSDLIASLTHPAVKRWLDARKLREILQTDHRTGFDASHEIREVCDLVENHLVDPTQVFERSFRRRLRENAEWSPGEIADLPFPRWPAANHEGVEPLTSVHQLIQEGREMEHCVGSLGYITAALRGELAVFRVTWPVRATLAMRPHAGSWVVAEIRGVRNAEIDVEHFRQIAEHR